MYKRIIIKIPLIILFIASIYFPAHSQILNLEKNDLLNGRLSQELKTNIEGHPYLFNNQFYNTSIDYKGNKYSDKLIKYNIYNQEIIFYQNIDSSLSRFIILNQHYLREFRIKPSNTEFIFTNKYWNIEGLPNEIKYYELAYDGNIKYLIGRIKTLNKSTTVDSKDKYELEESHFLIIENISFRIKGKRDIYSIYKKDKKKLKDFIKSNDLNVKLKNREDLIELLIYCESFKLK